MINTLMKLGGAVFSATNRDFVVPQNDEEGKGSGGDEAEETERQEDGDGEKSETKDNDTDAEDSDSGSGDDSDESESDESESDESESDESESTDSDEEDSDDESTGTDGGEESEDGSEPEGNDSSSDSGDTDSANSQEAGGETGETTEKEIGDALLNAMEEGEGTGLVDNNSALQDAMEGNQEGEKCEDDERVWRPYRPHLDTIGYPRVRNEQKAKRLQNQVKKEIAYLTNKMRSKFLQARAPSVVHGVRHGRELSERRLVESVTELRSGRRPTRPDWTRVNKPECSLAVAVVLDQSGSMRGDEADVARAALAIATPMDKLACSCLVVGPRSGRYCYDSVNPDYYGDGTYRNRSTRYHRDSGVHIDVFKDWEEPMRRALPRFSSVQASGGTPLSDGIQYAMQELSRRTERYRVIIVLTDGQPNCPDVVRRQIRLAKDAGVTIVGVGISNGCYSVPHMFPANYVSVNRITDLPRNMLAVLDAIMFPNRAKRIKLDGKLSGTRVSGRA